MRIGKRRNERRKRNETLRKEQIRTKRRKNIQALEKEKKEGEKKGKNIDLKKKERNYSPGANRHPTLANFSYLVSSFRDLVIMNYMKEEHRERCWYYMYYKCTTKRERAETEAE